MQSHQLLTTLLFLAVVALTVAITVWASRQGSGTANFYAGGRSFTPLQNGFAIGGDYMSAASFLGISGAIALSGYDGFLYSVGFLVAWLVALLLVAEMLRNSGRYTMADQLAYRMKQRPVRMAAATSTVVVSIFYLLAQMVGAGTLVALLLNVESQAVKNLVIFAVGILMIFYVTVGGMKGTTWVQIVKAVLLMVGSALIVVLVLVEFNFNISDLLGTAASNSGKGSAFLEPGLKYGVSTTSKLDFLSLGIALVLGTAGLPHILIRFYTVPTSRDARKSVLWAIGLIGVFYLFTLVLGFGAAALLKGDQAEKVATSKGNLASPLLAEAVGGGAGSTGGAVLLAVISAVAFATILAVVAGLTLTSSASVAHDIYNNVVKKGKATEQQEIRVTRIAALTIGLIARQDPAQRRRQRMDRVQGRVAVHPRVQVTLTGADPDVEGGEPASGDRERRKVPVLHATVEDDARVGAALVLLQKLDDRLATDLLLAVGDDADVDRQRALGGEQAGCVQQHPELALVIRHAAGIQPLAADRRLERVRLPELQRRRRLDVEVPVAEDRRGVGGVARSGDLADDERPLPVRDELGLAAAAANLVRDPLGRMLEVVLVRGVGAHRGDAQQLGELVEPALGEFAHGGESSQTPDAAVLSTKRTGTVPVARLTEGQV